MTDFEKEDVFGFIGVHQLRIDCIVGVYDEERQQEQTLMIDLKVKIPLSRCIASGKLGDTISYVSLANLCTRLAKKNYFLLESFASDILDQCIKEFSGVWAWVRVQKPSAIPTACYAYVELERHSKRI